MDKLYVCSDILRILEKRESNPKALNTREAEGWRFLSTEQVLESIKWISLGLVELGLERGERVGLLANPSGEWTIVDLAIMIAGGVSVPLFANISEENFLYEVNEAQIKILFVDGEEQWPVFQSHAPLFKKVIALSRDSHGQISLDELKAKGRLLEERDPGFYQRLRERLKPDDLGAIIYTSGSTGIPKGAELTHGNLTCMLNFPGFHWNPEKDRYLSVLPLAHVFGHCINLWVLTWGVPIYYSTDYKNLGMICQEVHPTATVVVPRLLEKIYGKMSEQIHAAEGVKGLIAKWALSLAKKENPSHIDRLLHPLADFLLYRKFRIALGNEIRLIISGGASLNPHLERFFTNIGIIIYEGWGLTEACPLSVNKPGYRKAGTVGLPLPEHIFRISDEGEVLVQGPLVMRGYYCNPELTQKTIGQGHWLHTGDKGFIDKDGFLTISGRMKELYKTSTGEYVAPVPIEQAFGRDPLIDMSMVVAEGRKFASCLFFPNIDVLKRMKEKNHAETLTDEDFLKSDPIRKKIDSLINEVNKHVNHWEEIHAYRFVLEPLTIQNGELTPSMKIRREVVAKKYRRLIDEMYKN